MTLIEIKTVTITDKGQIAIPKSIRTQQGFSTGSKLAILTYDDCIELRPVSQISSKLKTAVASEKALAKDWNSAEDDKAWKNL